MFGERYLATRNRLADLVSAITKLGERSRADLGDVDVDEVERSLMRSMRVVVCGEGDVGKTSFLEVLLGRNLEDLEEKSKGGEVVIYRDVVNRVRDSAEDVCEKRYRDRLREMEVVDASGVGKLNNEKREALKYLIGEADYVFWVLSAENPWAASTWDFVTEMREEVGNCSAVILQQVDRREAADVPLLVGHLRDLCLQRVGHAIPIFPVSAKVGMSAGAGENRNGEVWESSGFGLCERELNHFLNRGSRRRGVMKGTYDLARDLLLRIEGHIDNRSRSLWVIFWSLSILE